MCTGCRKPAKEYEGDDDKGAFNFNMCSNSFVIPASLSDGKYTIQWGLYGGFDKNYKKKDGTLLGRSGAKEGYKSCLDINVKGGSPLTTDKLCAQTVSCVAFVAQGTSGPEFSPAVVESSPVSNSYYFNDYRETQKLATLLVECVHQVRSFLKQTMAFLLNVLEIIKAEEIPTQIKAQTKEKVRDLAPL